jgi:hypothetical protein
MAIRPNHLVRACVLAILLPLSAYAVPVISGPFVFTEHRNATPVNPAGHTFVVGSPSITPSGPGTTVSATHVPLGSGPDYSLGLVPFSFAPDQYAIRTAYTGQSGQWDITATDSSGSTTLRTHTLDDVRVLPLITGFSVSGPGLAPHLAWDPVDTSLFPSSCAGGPTLGCDFFRYSVEVRMITGTPGNPAPRVFISPGIPTTEATVFDLAPGILAPGINYLLGIGLNHFEFEVLSPGGPLVAFVENRSTMLVEHSAPEPGTVLLLSVGLAGTLAIRATRRRTKSADAGR